MVLDYVTELLVREGQERKEGEGGREGRRVERKEGGRYPEFVIQHDLTTATHYIS